MLTMLTMNKVDMFIKAQMILVKISGRMLPNIRQMSNISSLTDDWRATFSKDLMLISAYHMKDDKSLISCVSFYLIT